MGVRGELFTTEVSLDNRTYFFNVEENRTGDVFLQVVESKSLEGTGFDRHAIVVFEDDMQRFLQGLENTLKFIEKTRKEKLKAGAAKPAAAKKKVYRKNPDGETTRAPRNAESSGEKTPRAAPRRVKVISKKDQEKK